MLNKAIAQKVLDMVDKGLCHGLGTPEPGKMCVEAAVCYALGEPHNDRPTCVGDAVRSFKIVLNDSKWSSNYARAKGMREIAIAQLGSNEIDQTKFSELLIIKTIKIIVPLALRSAASICPKHSAALEIAAKACEIITDLASGKAAAYAAANAADAAANAAAYAAANAADAAAYAADAAANAAANAADAAANAAAYAADAAANAADGKATACDKVLSIAATLGVEVLKELSCKGTEWLFLCNKDKS